MRPSRRPGALCGPGRQVGNAEPQPAHGRGGARGRGLGGVRGGAGSGRGWAGGRRCRAGPAPRGASPELRHRLYKNACADVFGPSRPGSVGLCSLSRRRVFCPEWSLGQLLGLDKMPEIQESCSGRSRSASEARGVGSLSRLGRSSRRAAATCSPGR